MATNLISEEGLSYFPFLGFIHYPTLVHLNNLLHTHDLKMFQNLEDL